MLEGEMTDRLGYRRHDPAGYKTGNSRNGRSQKTLKGDFSELKLETPRDRNATFEPRVVAKNQTRWRGFDDKILSMHARGMSTRDIEAHRKEIYGVDVSPTLISTVTEEVREEVRAWQNRPLEALYPICTWTRCTSRCATTGMSRTARCTSPSASIPKA
jgi:putative transposase